MFRSRILERLLKLSCLWPQISQGHQYDSTVADRFGYPDANVEQASVLLTEKVDASGWLAYQAHRAGQDFNISSTEINMKESGENDRRGERVVRGEWQEQGQVACEILKLVNEDRIVVIGRGVDKRSLKVSDINLTDGHRDEYTIGLETTQDLGKVIDVQNFAQSFFIVTESDRIVKLRSDFSEATLQSFKGAKLLGLARTDSASEDFFILSTTEGSAEIADLYIDKVVNESPNTILVNQPLKSTQISPAAGLLFTASTQPLEMPDDAILFITAAMSADSRLMIIVTSATTAELDEEETQEGDESTNDTDSGSDNDPQNEPDNASQMEESSDDENGSSDSTDGSDGAGDQGESAQTDEKEKNRCWSLFNAYTYCSDQGSDSEGGRRLQQRQIARTLTLFSHTSTPAATLLSISQPDDINDQWHLYMLETKTKLVKISVKLMVSGNSSSQIEVEYITASIHSFNYTFMNSAASYSFSATRNSDILLFALSSQGFYGESLKYQQAFMLTSQPLRPSSQYFWSTEHSTIGSFSISQADNIYSADQALTIVETKQFLAMPVQSFSNTTTSSQSKEWVKDNGVAEPKSERWDETKMEHKVQGVLELLISYADDKSAQTAAIQAKLGPQALVYTLDTSHLLTNQNFITQDDDVMDYMKLLYKETYSIIPCDAGGQPMSEANFSPSQFAAEVPGPDNQTRKVYRIPLGATAYDCLIVTDAYELLGGASKDRVATVSPASMRIWILSDESVNREEEDGNKMGQKRTNKFAEMLYQIQQPGFQQPPPDHIEVKLGEALLMSLGQLRSKDNKVEVNLGRATGFMLFDPVKNQLSIAKGALTQEQAGLYIISIKVSGLDANGEPTQSSYKIKLTVIPSYADNDDNNVEDEDTHGVRANAHNVTSGRDEREKRDEERVTLVQNIEQAEDQVNLTRQPAKLRLSRIEIDGSFHIQFSKAIRWPDDIESRLNNSTLPKNSRMLLPSIISLTVKQEDTEDTETQEQLKYTWIATSIEGRAIHCQLNFEQPLSVSQGYDLDQLYVSLSLDGFFDEQGVPLESTVVLQTSIPRQLSPSEAKVISQGAQATQAATSAILGSSFLVNLLLAASLSQLWSMLNGLQLAVHLPLFDLSFPVNASSIIEFIITVATFDLVPPELILSIFTLPDDVDAFSESFDATGYSSLYPIENLGTCWLLVQIYIFLVFLWLILYMVGKKFPKNSRLRNIREKIGKFTFWRAALRFLFQGYLELCLSVFIGWHQMDWQELTASVLYSNLFTIAFTFLLLALPIWLILFFCCYARDKLQDPDYRQKYGTLYAELDLSITDAKGNKQISSLAFTLLFVVRRLVFALSAIYLNKNYVSVQLAIQFASSLGLIFYIQWYRPFINPKMARIETFNEVIEIVLLYHMQTFSQFVPDAEMRYKMGWSFISVLALYLVVHFTMLIASTVHNIKLNFKRCKAQYRVRKARKKNEVARVNQPEPDAIIMIRPKTDQLAVISEESLVEENQARLDLEVVAINSGFHRYEEEKVVCHSEPDRRESGSTAMSSYNRANSPQCTLYANTIIAHRRGQRPPKQRIINVSNESSARSLAQTAELVAATNRLLLNNPVHSVPESGFDISYDFSEEQRGTRVSRFAKQPIVHRVIHVDSYLSISDDFNGSDLLSVGPTVSEQHGYKTDSKRYTLKKSQQLANKHGLSSPRSHSSCVSRGGN